MELKMETKYKLEEFVRDLLKKRFKDEPQKQGFNIDGEKINFSCPYCGDSDKKKSKKRGNIYLESNTYKCFNDGCMTYAPLDKFIAYHAHKYNLDPPDVFIKGNIKAKIRTRKKNFLVEFLGNHSITGSLLTVDYFADRFGLEKIEDFTSTDATVEFLKRRKLDHIPDIGTSCYHDKRRNKIYIFNLDAMSGKILGFAERSVIDGYMGPKYKIKTYSEIHREIVPIDLDTEQMKEVDHMNNFFNVLNIDFTEVITVTEGQFDSMFVYNSLATTGISKSKDMIEFLNENGQVRILFDNDTPGKTATLDFLLKGYTVFLWSKLIQDLKKRYNSELKKIKKIKDINDLYVFLSSLVKDLNINKFNSILEEYFSDSPFDAIYV